MAVIKHCIKCGKGGLRWEVLHGKPELVDDGGAMHVCHRVRCNRCGRMGLSWHEVNGKYRLYEGNNQHKCRK